MASKKWSFRIGLGILILTAGACSFSVSTANISALKLGTDKAVSSETSRFSTSDTIYAVAVISNAPGKVRVRGRLAVEDVEGQQTGPIPGLETSLDLEGSGSATFTFSAPTAGWPKGKYKLDVILLNEDGAQQGQKSASFTVS